MVDSSTDKAGVLKVTNFAPAANNSQMPIYNGTDGYVFATMVEQVHRSSEMGADTFKLIFKPYFGTATINELLKGGGNAAQVNIGIRLKWTDKEGNPQSKDLTYTDEMVKEVYAGTNKAFYIEASGATQFDDLTITPFVKSNMGAKPEWSDSKFDCGGSESGESSSDASEESSESSSDASEESSEPSSDASEESSEPSGDASEESSEPSGDASENTDIILSDDFESYATNATVSGNVTWATISDTSASVIIAEESGKKMVQASYTGTDASANAIMKINLTPQMLSGYQSVTISMDVWIESTNSLALPVYNLATGKKLGNFNTLKVDTGKVKEGEWTPVKMVFDFTGEKPKQTFILPSLAAPQVKEYPVSLEAGFALGLSMTLNDTTGKAIQIDNIVVEGEKIIDDTTGDTDYTKPESGEGVNIILEDDFEDYKVDANPHKNGNKYTGSAINAVAVMKVVEETTENKVLKAYHGAPTPEATKRAPRIEKVIGYDNLTNLTIDFDAKISEGDTTLSVGIYNKDTSKSILYYTLKYTQCVDWTHVKVICDLEKNTQEIYVGGELAEIKTADLRSVLDKLQLRFVSSVAPDESFALLDNVLLTTTDELPSSMVDISTMTVNWDKVALVEGEETGIMDIMRDTHPRIFVQGEAGWDAIKDKINNDVAAAKWYDILIEHATKYINTDVTSYHVNDRGNINECSTLFKDDIIPAVMAYCLLDDSETELKGNLKTKIYNELQNVGNWPEWGSNAYLCTAHIILAYGICYDWMFDDWTDEERTNILGWLMDKGMHEAVLNYAGYDTGTNFTRNKNNWNNVCNGSNIVGAIAIAGEYPKAADYIIKKASDSIPYSFSELSVSGAFAEPLSYWDYAIRYQIKFMSALESCIVDNATLPTCLDFANLNSSDTDIKDYATGLSNTGDFVVYYNGFTGAFNYGDGQPKLITTPNMYWLSEKFDNSAYTWYNFFMEENSAHVVSTTPRTAALSLIWYEIDNNNVSEAGFCLDKFYQSYEAKGTNGLSMRSSWEDQNGLFLAAHAGDQSVSHSNLDSGGFVLDWNDHRWVHMYGASPGGISTAYGWPNFTIKTEKDGRYSYYHTRGEANNTIIANPIQDCADMNIKYFTQVESYYSGENTSFGIIDNTTTNEIYNSAKRGFMLTGNRDVVVVRDEINAKEATEYWWFVNTNAEVTLSQDGRSALWEMEGDRMLVRISESKLDGAENSAVKFGMMKAEPLPTSPDPEIQPDIDEHKMYIHIDSAATLELMVEFIPLEEGEGIPTALNIPELSQWQSYAESNDRAKLTSQILGDIIAVLEGSPNAYAKGAKTRIDVADSTVTTIKVDDKIYIPASFVRQWLGKYTGSDILTKDEINYISVDALATAFRKTVSVQENGLVLISNNTLNYDATTLDKIFDLLNTRVFYGNKEIKFFEPEVTEYNVQISKNEGTPQVSVDGSDIANVTQGNPASVVIGDTTYTINFVENPFEDLAGTGSAGVVNTISLGLLSPLPTPSEQTWISVQNVTSSIGAWEDSANYIEKGTIDGIISTLPINRWSAKGLGSWICYDLGSAQTIYSMAIAGYNSSSRQYTFKIEYSMDGESWEIAEEALVTTAGNDHEVFRFPDGVSARYIKVTGLEAHNTNNSPTDWIGINEVRIYANEEMQNADQAAWIAYFYPAIVYGHVGENIPLKVNGVDKEGNEVAVDTEIVYTSADESIATVSVDGVVTLKSTGTTTIQAETIILGVTKIATFDVIVQ